MLGPMEVKPPQNYIWAQKKGRIHGFVMNIGHKYKIEFYTDLGQLLETRFESTLEKAKRNVFMFLSTKRKGSK